MRHEATYVRRATVWQDFVLAFAVFAGTTALVLAIALWTHYVTGALAILTTAILAWHSGFRPALIATALNGLVIGPLIILLDAQAVTINLPVRILSTIVVSLVV